MKANLPQPRKNQNPSATVESADKKTTDQHFQFTDQRAEATAQRRRQEMVDNSPYFQKATQLNPATDRTGVQPTRTQAPLQLVKVKLDNGRVIETDQYSLNSLKTNISMGVSDSEQKKLLEGGN